MPRGAFAVLSMAAAFAACTSRPAAVPVDPVADARTEWKKDDQLEETWHGRSENGLRASVALRRGGGTDVVHVMTGAGELGHWPHDDSSARDPAAQRVSIEVAGVPAGTVLGTTTYSLGWHLVEHDAALRVGEPLVLEGGYQRAFHVDAGRALGARTLTAGTYRLDVVATDGASTRRLPVVFRVGEKCGNE